MQSIGNVWVEKYVIAEEQNVARSIEMYLSRTPAAITPLGLVGNPVLKAWSNGHMLTDRDDGGDEGYKDEAWNSKSEES